MSDKDSNHTICDSIYTDCYLSFESYFGRVGIFEGMVCSAAMFFLEWNIIMDGSSSSSSSFFIYRPTPLRTYAKSNYDTSVQASCYL